MVKKQNKKHIALFILIAFFALSVVAVFISSTLALYTSSLNGYTTFNVGYFNALILGENTIEEMTLNPSETKEYGIDLDITGISPGDTGDDAKTIPFSISNGISETDYTVDVEYTYTGTDGGTVTGIYEKEIDADVTQVAVEYTIKIRTLANLPLTYTLEELKAIADDVDEGEEITYTYTYTVENSYEASEPVEVVDSNGTVWYEYSFVVSVDEEVSEEQISTEQVFELEALNLELDSYRLKVEWIIDHESDEITNSIEYMKEIECIQIIVAVSSQNQENEDGSVSSSDYVVIQEGLIILDPKEGTAQDDNDAIVNYDYTIDYRSFHTQTTGEELEVVGDEDTAVKFVNINIENGIGKGVEQTSEKIEFTMEFIIPYVDESIETYYVYNKSTDELVKLSNPVYYVYDIVDDVYEKISTSDNVDGKPVLSSSLNSDRYIIVEIYTITDSMTLYNQTTNDAGTIIEYIDSVTYTLYIKDYSDELDGEIIMNVNAEFISSSTTISDDSDDEITD